MAADKHLRELIRAELPPEALRREPKRALYALPLVLAIVLGTTLVGRVPLVQALLISLVIGHCYAGLAFLAHDIGHGAITRSRRFQDLGLLLGFAIFLVPPRLWRTWHNESHHPHANIDGEDPDSFGGVGRWSEASSLERLCIRHAPGSGSPVSIVYPFIAFTLHAQIVLFVRSKAIAQFRHLSRGRAITESILLAVGWIALAFWGGPRVTVFGILIPMAIANAVLMSYIFTNHMLRPLVAEPDILTTTMSVTTSRLLDRLHFNFSHHVEHHLFPRMSSRYYPLVRQSLRRHAGERYLAPRHAWALAALFNTPRMYADERTVIEPTTGRRVCLTDVETLLMETMH